MAEDALRRFTAMGPGDSYWDTYIETAKKGADLARDVARGAAKAPGQAFEWLTGVPSWAFWVGGAVVLGGVGVGAWKLLVLATPAVAGAAARRYMP
jgi:hypothetical protein